MTPLAAAAPYKAEADGPLSTFMLSMSSTLPNPKLDGTPSIITRGELLPFMERSPRIIIRDPPFAPVITDTPATFPANASPMSPLETVARLSISTF